MMDWLLYIVKIVSIIAYIIFLIYFLIRILICRQEVQQYLIDIDDTKRVMGSFSSGEFFMQPLFHMEIQVNNNRIQDVINTHNKFINWFWLNNINLIVYLIIRG